MTLVELVQLEVAASMLVLVFLAAVVLSRTRCWNGTRLENRLPARRCGF